MGSYEDSYELEGSMTPPLSPCEPMMIDSYDHHPPTSTDFTQEADSGCSLQLTCFKCHGEVTTEGSLPPYRNTYIWSGVLNRLLEGADPSPQMFRGRLSELFGYRFLTESAAVESTQKLFYMARQQLSQLEGLAEEGSSWVTGGSVNTEALHLRQQVTDFLQYIKVFLHRYFDPPSLPDSHSHPYSHQVSQFPQGLLQQLQGLLFHVGQLGGMQDSTVSSAVSRQAVKSSTPAHSFFHVVLDIYWSAVEILYILQTKWPDLPVHMDLSSFLPSEDIGDRDLLTQLLTALLWDLLSLAAKIFNKVTQQECPRVSPFPCTCVRELWIMLIHMLDHRSQHMQSDSFWCTLYNILCLVLQENTTDFSCKDPVGFCWWLLSHIAPLYQYDQNGQFVDKQQVKSNWLLVQDLIKKTLATKDQPRLDESRLRCQLKFCLSLSHLWEPNTQAVVLVWEYYSKRLNDLFQVPGLTLQGLASVSKTALSWYEKCKERCNDHTLSRDQENSFQLFLRLLAVQLRHPVASGELQGWKQIKGRFYSKFHQRRMQELTAIGLSNFITLFLTLALVADVNDVAGKMQDLLDLLNHGLMDFQRRTIIWKGVFALMQVHEHRQVDMGHLADRMAKSFNRTCSEFSQKGLDPSLRHQLWALLSIYVESTQDLCENSTLLHLSQAKLLGPGFSQLLPVCRENELRTVFNFIQTLLAKHRSLYKRALRQQEEGVQLIQSTNIAVLQQHYKDIADALWTNIFPYVKKHSMTLTPPPTLADVAAGFTFLALDLPSPPDFTRQQQTFSSIFQYFGPEDSVCASICCRYLCHLIPNQSFMDQLSAECPVYQSGIIHAWFRCVMQTYGHNDQMQELTRLVLRLPEMEIILHSQHVTIESSDSPETVAVKFIKAIGRHFNSLQSLQEKTEYRDRVMLYFGNVLRYMGPYLKNSGPAEALRVGYHMVGCMVKHCTRILYVQSNPRSVLPSLVDRLILPRTIFNPEKTLHPAVMGVIRDHLHLFVQGLSKLSYKRDPFVQKALRDILQQYFHRFSVKSGSFTSAQTQANHPLLLALSETMSNNPSTEASQFRVHLLEGIRDTYMTLRSGSLPNRVTETFSFILELFRRTQTSGQIARDTPVLLSTVLEYQLLCDMPAIRKQVSEMLQFMMESCQQCPDVTPRTVLLPILRDFLARNLRLHQSRTFKPFETLALLYKDLIADLIPVFTNAVLEVEKKRGVGADTQLRQAYTSLLNQLGQKGQEQLDILNTEHQDPIM
ncbi:protein MMS22-like [Branchiostoma floridae x Branchiostoma belcheri]